MNISIWLHILFFIMFRRSVCTENRYNERILGGEETQILSHPYHVYISGKYFSCGGAIIKKRWILTAGHCYFTANATTVFAGSNIRGKGKPYEIISATRMPLYEIQKGEALFNLMLLKLKKPLVYGPAIQSIPIARECDCTAGNNGTVTGFGVTKYSGHVSQVLHKVELTIMALDVCKRHWRKTFHACSQMCAGHPEGGRSVWMGDDGGPFVVNGKLVGVASHAYRVAGDVVMFASVPKLRAWIYSVTGVK